MSNSSEIVGKENNDSRENEIKEQLLDVNSKIEKEKLKEEKLLKIFIENMISDKEYEYYHKKMIEKIDKLTLEKYDLEYKISTLESVEDRVKKVKNHMRRLLDFSYEGVNESLIDEFVAKIIVHEEYFEWKLKNINISLNIAISGRKNSSDTNIQILNLD